MRRELTDKHSCEKLVVGDSILMDQRAELTALDKFQDMQTLQLSHLQQLEQQIISRQSQSVQELENR
ncbi:MAG: hypothetical protein WBP64_07820 [Nitrososphaeraceae archaeon]